MSNQTHTPGPWRFWRNFDYWGISPIGVEGKDNMDGNDADYRLMAAAPELLEALDDLLALLNQESLRPMLDDAERNRIARAIAAARKARGEA